LTIPRLLMFETMVSLFCDITSTSCSPLGSLHAYYTWEHRLMAPLIQHLYAIANDLSPIILALRWMMTTNVSFPKMWVDHGFVHLVHLFFFQSIIWLVSNVHNCTTSRNCVYSLIYNSPFWTCLIMVVGFYALNAPTTIC